MLFEVIPGLFTTAVLGRRFVSADNPYSFDLFKTGSLKP